MDYAGTVRVQKSAISLFPLLPAGIQANGKLLLPSVPRSSLLPVVPIA
jgi:hypothetical protein